MAYSVNWATKVVTIPQADLLLVSPGIYELDVISFWVNIHDIQDGEGMPYEDIMASNAPTSFGPRGVLIVNGYRVEFEDGAYQVNLIGANSDIELNRVQNNVSITNKIANGLDAAAIAAAVWGQIVESGLTALDYARIDLASSAGRASGAATTEMRFRDTDNTKDRIVATVDEYGNRLSITLDPS